MRVIVAGSRGITDYETVARKIRESGFEITQIISGGARGVDALGEQYARHHGIPVSIKNANWNLHGRSAGYKRNEEMAQEADALIAIWDGQSKGTKHMIDIARARGLKVHL